MKRALYIIHMILFLLMGFNSLHAQSKTIKIKNLGSITLSKTPSGKVSFKLPILGKVDAEANYDTASKNYTISAKLSTLSWKPLKATRIPKIKDIALKEPSVSIQKEGKEYTLTFTGIVNMFGKNLEGMLAYKRANKKTAGWVFTLKIPGNVSPFSFIPGLGVFKKLNFQDSYIVASTMEYEDSELDATISKGIGFLTYVPTTGPLKAINTILNLKKGKISLYGVITKSAILFKARLGSGKAKSNARVKFGALELELSAKPTPSFALLGSFYVRPSKNDDYLKFTSRMALSPTSVRLAGTMAGTWNKPFGIKGFSVGNVALEGAINIQTGLPSALGFTGEMQVAGKKVSTGVMLDLIQINKSLLQFSLNKLSLRDLVSLAKKMGLRLPKVLIPNIGFKNIGFKFAPAGGQIGEIKFEKGISFHGEANVLKTKMMVDGQLSAKKIAFQGSMSSINLLGILKLNKSKSDPKSKKGPYIDMELSRKRQKLTISGAVNILGLKQDTYIDISLRKAVFKISRKAGSWFQADLNGSYEISKKPDFAIGLSIKNNIGKEILRKVKKIPGIKQVMSLILKSFKISSISFKGSLQALGRGKTPQLDARFKLFGKNIKMKIAANLSKPSKIVKSIVAKIKSLAKKYLVDMVKRATKEVAKKVKKATKKAGKAIAKGAKKVISGAKKALHKVGKAVVGFFKKKKRKRKKVSYLKNLEKRLQGIMKISLSQLKNVVKTSRDMVKKYGDNSAIIAVLKKEFSNFLKSVNTHFTQAHTVSPKSLNKVFKKLTKNKLLRRLFRKLRKKMMAKVKELQHKGNQRVKIYISSFDKIAWYIFYKAVTPKARVNIRLPRFLKRVYSPFLRIR